MIKVRGVLWLFLIAACVGRKDSVEGVYVRLINNEYALGDDTLLIKAVNATTYQVEKRSKFQRTVKVRGKIPPTEFHKRSWTGLYDKEHNLIREANQGKVIVFSEDKDLLVMGSLEYKRIAD